jgi:hypothetical protein
VVAIAIDVSKNLGNIRMTFGHVAACRSFAISMTLARRLKMAPLE